MSFEYPKRPLSQSELGIFLACQNPTLAYNLPFFLELTEDLKKEDIKEAVRAFFALHPAMNLRFGQEEDGTVYQTVVPEEPAFYEKEAPSLESVGTQPFSVTGGPLYRFTFYRIGEKQFFYFEFHHLLVDGGTLKIFLTDLMELIDGRGPEAESYTVLDFARDEEAERRSPAYEEAEAYFKETFSGIEGAPLLPFDRKEESVRHDVIKTRLAAKASDIVPFIREKKVRASAFFVSAFAFLLAKMNGEREAYLATIHNGRTPLTARSVGMYVKTLPFVTRFTDDQTVEEFLKAASRQLSATVGQDLFSFSDAAQKLGLGSEVMFAYQGDYMFEVPHGEATHRLINGEIPEGKGILSAELHKDGDEYEIWMEYRADLYERETVWQIIALYDRTLAELIRCRTLGEIDLLDEAQKAALDAVNVPDLSYFRPDATVVDYFAEQAAERPDHPLVVYRNKTVTYGEAEITTRKIAGWLAARGIGRERVVSVLIPRNEYIVLASLGILTAGAAYQPLDPSYPAERLNFMIRDAAAAALIVDRSLEDLLDYDGPKLYLDEIEALPAPEAVAWEAPKAGDLFIMLYTSGTTGQPKGVMLEHGSILNFSLYCHRLYEMDGDVRAAAYASYGFDADMMDLYPTITAGGTVYIIPEDMRLDLMALAAYYDEAGITHSFITTQVGRQFAELTHPKTLKHLSVGGEKLVPLDPPKGYALHNLYGPTEGTVFCCDQPVDKLYYNIPIGKHTDLYRFYVLDEAGRRVPWGVKGELYISGPQLARGYLNRPAENEKAFLSNPFDPEPPFERLYRTGDVVRFLKDGRVDFVGRSDGQVKIRGFRVELAEVEQVIRRFPGVKDATVKDFTDPAGVKFIAGYVVADEPLDLEELRHFIGSEKPPYMIPASLMQIEAIPLTQNQKVNKRALPAPKPREQEIIPPENEREQKVFDIVSAILGHSAFGVTTDLYEAGLTSVSSIRLCVQLSQAFERPFKNSELAEASTVRELALLSGESVQAVDFTRRGAYPLTKTQEGIFIECMAKPGSTVYNIPYLFKLDPGIDPERLTKAVKDTLRAHPYAMSHLAMNEDGDVVVLREEVEPAVSVIRHDPDIASLVRPFTLIGEDLYRAEIYLGRENNYLFLDLHHIFCDGTSEMILLEDISDAYEGKTLTEETYSGYEIGLQEQADRESEAFDWARVWYDELLKGEETDYLPKKDLKTGPARLEVYETEPSLSYEQLLAFAKKYDLSLSAVFNFAFGLVLSRFVYKDRALFTTIYNGRSDSRTVRSVSMLVKTLPVLVKTQEDDRIADLIRALKRQIEGSQQHDIYSFAEVAQAYGVTADILFIYHGGAFKLDKLGGYPVESIVLASDTPKSPIAFNIFLEGGHYRFRLEYDGSLYSRDSMSSLARCLTHVLGQFGSAERVKDLSYVSNTDRAMLEKFNATEQEIPNVTFNKLLEVQAERVPDKKAVIASNGSFTYVELNRAANRVAHALIGQGIGAGDKVAVILPRIKEAYAAREGVLKTGAAFVPIDPAYPDERIAYIIRESGAGAVIVNEKVAEERQSLLEGCGVPALLAETLTTEGSGENPELPLDPAGLAYIIFTSGSTGKPKGVMITHRNLVNLCSDGLNVATEYYREIGDPVCYSFASLSFDASVQEECVPLSHGYTAVIASEEEINNPILMAKTILEEKVSIMFMTPSFAANIVDVEPVMEALRGLKALLLAAESVPPELIAKLRARGVTAVIYNGYGPTETTVGCTYHRILDEYVTIGKPVANAKIFLLDPHGHELPVHAIGDLTIAGAGVGKGYLHMPEKTAEKFITVEGLPAFRSGDLARYNSEGQVEFFGRMDNQVKLRGLRVELDEIEKAITSYEGISSAVVVVKNAPEGDYLCGYYTAGALVDKNELTAFMGKSLTPYMIPKVLMQLEAFPLTPNGKVDKRNLPEPVQEKEEVRGKAPADALEKKIAGLFAKSLGMDQVGTDQNFFDLGGTSLSASKVAMLAVGAGLPIAYKDVFDFPTVEAMAAHVKAAGTKEMAQQILSDASEGEGKTGEEALAHNRIEELADIAASRPLGRVLLTGASGFLGIHVLRELLRQEIPAIALVRGSGELDAPTRLKGMLMYYFDSPLDEEVERLVTVIDGDVTNATLSRELEGKAFDTIINCAACVKHFAADDIIERVNVGGVKNMIELAKARGARLIHISTLSVAGENIDNRLPAGFRLKETQLAVGQDISNKYVNSKFKAEEAVLAAIPEGVDAKIIRVGNLMGRDSDGEFQINSVTNGFIRDLKSYKVLACFPVSAGDGRVDFSPIDRVAEAILLLARTPEKFTLFHAANSHTVEMGDIVEAMNRCGFAIRIVPDDTFGKALSAMMEDPDKNMLVSSLISYASRDNHVHEFVPSDNSFTVKALYRLGFKWPITDERYLTSMIDALASLDFFDNEEL